MANFLALTKRYFIFGILFFWAILPISAFSSTLFSQLEYCKTALEVSKMPPSGSCFGSNTKAVSATGERLGYFRLNDVTDAVFHCDNVNESTQTLSTNSDIEMIIHNRSNGGTCFFFHEPDSSTSPNFPSMNGCNSSGCSAASYWRRADASIGVAENCTFCHKNSGPYFIHESAEAMAHFGLINNGHDTHHDRYFVANVDSSKETTENNNINLSVSDTTCGLSCHNFTFPVQQNVDSHNPNPINFRFDQFVQMVSEGLMAPSDSQSHFRWVNRDTPNASGDYETYSNVKTEYPDLASCTTPSYMEAHVVGNSHILASNSKYFKNLKSFNAVDGLVCLNDPSKNYTCKDYRARFKCSDGNWTAWQNNDSPNASGDYERPPSNCANPTEIQGGVNDNQVTGSDAGAYGFRDRLAQFDNKGLVCKNADQPDGECDNYVVRFVCASH